MNYYERINSMLHPKERKQHFALIACLLRYLFITKSTESALLCNKYADRKVIVIVNRTENVFITHKLKMHFSHVDCRE